jgi:hypothetical protein
MGPHRLHVVACRNAKHSSMMPVAPRLRRHRRAMAIAPPAMLRLPQLICHGSSRPASVRSRRCSAGEETLLELQGHVGQFLLGQL